MLEVADDPRPIEIDQLPEVAHRTAADAALRQGVPPALKALVKGGGAAVLEVFAAEDEVGDVVTDRGHAGPIDVVSSAGWRQPAAVDQHGRAGPQPVAVVDGHVWPLLSLQVGEVRSYQHGRVRSGEVTPLFDRQWGKAAEQLVGRPGQRQRLQVVNVTILEETDAHAEILSALLIGGRQKQGVLLTPP